MSERIEVELSKAFSGAVQDYLTSILEDMKNRKHRVDPALLVAMPSLISLAKATERKEGIDAASLIPLFLISQLRPVAEKDEIDKELDRQAKIATLRHMQMTTMMTPFGMPVLEPAVDKDGKPMTDEQGNRVYRINYRQPSQVTSDTSAAIVQMLDRMDKIREQYQQDVIKDLRDRLSSLEAKSTTDRLLDDIDKMKRLGLFDRGPESVEATKLRTDLERWKVEKDLDFRRWKHEQEIAMEKWREERREAREESKLTRQKITEIGETLRTCLTKIGAPIAESVAHGMKSSKTAAPATPVKPVEQMSTDELREWIKKADSSLRTIKKAKERLEQELSRRTSKGEVVPPAPTPTPTQETVPPAGST